MQGVKTGGRQKGTPNKITADLRGKLSGVVALQLEEIASYGEGTWKELSIDQRINLVGKLLPYVLPRAAEETPLE